MLRFAVLGHPVAHSLSPRMHADFAQQTGIVLQYEALDVAPEEFPQRVQALYDEGWAGCNVTLPHKAEALAVCARASDTAQRAGAINVLIRDDDGWRGDNTDGEGLLRDLRDNLDIPLRGRRIVVLGAGGAARGILEPLLRQEPAELVLSNRSPWKPEQIAQDFAPVGNIRPCTHLALKGDSFDLIINATSAGHGGHFPLMPEGLFDEGAVAYDLSYGRAHAPFAEWARAAGAERVIDGLGMLVEQGAVSFEKWHGVLPRSDALIARLRSEIEAS